MNVRAEAVRAAAAGPAPPAYEGAEDDDAECASDWGGYQRVPTASRGAARAAAGDRGRGRGRDSDRDSDAGGEEESGEAEEDGGEGSERHFSSFEWRGVQFAWTAEDTRDGPRLRVPSPPPPERAEADVRRVFVAPSCVVCLEAFDAERPAMGWRCGHLLCPECDARVVQTARQAGAPAVCPQCRGPRSGGGGNEHGNKRMRSGGVR